MAPAANIATVAVGVLVAFESFKHVVAFGVARFAGQAGGAVRAYATATDEHDQRFWINALLQLRQEVAVGLPRRIGRPLDFLGAGNAADPVPLGAGAHVDEFGAGCQLPDFVGFFRC